MTIKEILDHKEKAKARLPGFMQGATNLEAFLDAAVAESQNLETMLFQLLDERHLTVAVGAQLDGIGDILDLVRIVGETDSNYRTRLTSRTGELSRGGEIETLIAIFIQLTGLTPPDELQFQEVYPAAAIMTWLTDDVDTRDSNMAVKFVTGSNQRIFIPDDPSLKVIGDQTIEILLRANDVASSRRNPYNKAYGGEGTITQEISGSVHYYWGTSGADAAPFQGIPSPMGIITSGELVHLVLVRDITGGTIKWYKNGAEISSVAPLFGAAVSSSNDLKIGDGYAGDYDGDIYYVREYSRALTPAEVAEHYAGIYNDETGLVLYLPLIEGSGIIANDHSGSGNNGTLINGPTWEIVSNKDAELVSGMNAVRAAGVRLELIRCGVTNCFEMSDESEIVGGNGPIDAEAGFGDEALIEGGQLGRII